MLVKRLREFAVKLAALDSSANPQDGEPQPSISAPTPKRRSGLRRTFCRSQSAHSRRRQTNTEDEMRNVQAIKASSRSHLNGRSCSIPKRPWTPHSSYALGVTNSGKAMSWTKPGSFMIRRR